MPYGLEELLDETREAALRGDLITLSRLAESIALSVTTSQDADRQEVARLGAKARQTATLVDAAARGIRSALGRLDEIASGPTLTTYDATGRRAAITSVALQPLRRA